MWVLIYWVCTATACTAAHVPGFSSADTCEVARTAVEEKQSLIIGQRVTGVCINADISYFE
jgi:hypothetical protein